MATSKDFAGHFWPAGHRLGTPGVESFSVVYNPFVSTMNL